MWKSLLLCVALAVFSSTAFAQMQAHQCSQRSKMLDHLANKYKESRVATGVVTELLLAELLTTRNGSTWSILLTGSDGSSCLLAAGQNLTVGDLSKVRSYFTTEIYTKLVAFGYLNNGQKLIVTANNDLEWKMISFDQFGTGISILQGEGWQQRTVRTGPEA